MKQQFCTTLQCVLAATTLSACSEMATTQNPLAPTSPQVARAQESPQANRALHPMAEYDYAVDFNFPQASGSPYEPSGIVYGSSGAPIYGTSLSTWGSCVDCGGSAVFEVIPSTSQMSIVYTFPPDAALVETGVITDSTGSLYGTSYYGGAACGQSPDGGCGFIFKLTPNGSGWTETTLHTFSGGNDGAFPSGPLLILNQTLWGVANGGGNGGCADEIGCGVVYEISTSGTNFTVTHSFSGSDGYYPIGNLIAEDGTLYGTADRGGTGSCDSTLGCGTVFAMTPSGSEFATRHNFTGSNGSDGATPGGGVTYYNGMLYGTTALGGTSTCPAQGENPIGCGTIFQMTTAGGSYAIARNFNPAPNNEAPLPSGLIVDANGYLYGTAEDGGGCTNTKFPEGCGFIFRLYSSSGAYTVLHDFQGPTADGAFPFMSPLGGGVNELLRHHRRPFAGGAAAAIESSTLPFAIVPASAASIRGKRPKSDSLELLYGVTAEGGNGSCGGPGCGTFYQIDSTVESNAKRMP